MKRLVGRDGTIRDKTLYDETTVCAYCESFECNAQDLVSISTIEELTG